MAEDSEETGRTRQNLALYRKYRPATFAEVRGQDHVTQPLRQALRSGRINHAYLFSGPRGCGKTSSARILARSLNCVNGPTPDPCGVCDSCVALAPSGPGSIDVIEIDAASHGGVDDARDLRERAFYAPVAGRFKIYIIDEAHMVTQQGFNALLKLVEEPPPHLKFIFATTEPEKVIATIRSRTHHYPFRLMAPSVMRELTEEILNSEGVKFDPAVLPLVVRAGAGSARDTLSILDQLLAGSDDSGIRYDRAVALLGYTDATLLDEIVDAFAAGDGAAVFRVVNRVIEGGHEPRRFATDMLDRFRDLIVLASVPDAITTGLLDVPPDRAEALTAQASRSGLAALTRAAEIISAGLDQMRGATSPRLLLELICAQVLLPAAATDERSVLARLERLESGAVNQSYPERTLPAPEPSATPEPGRPGSAAPSQPAPGSDAGRPLAAQTAQPAPTAPAAPETDGPARPPAEPSRPHAARPAPAGPAVEPASSRAAPGAAAPAGPRGAATAETLRQGWDGVLEALKAKRRVAWMLLSNASVVSLDEGVLTLRFPRQGDVKGFQSSGYEDLLKQVLQARFGVNVVVRAVSGGDSPPGERHRQGPGPVPPPSAPPAGQPAGAHSGEAPAAADPPSDPPPAASRPAAAEPPSAPAPPADGAGRRGGGTGPFGISDLPPPPDEEFDPDDEDMTVPAAADLTGMALVQRELGAQIIAEYED
ncbi:MAG TPA: DNA polymerase III subunit gamma and tau [Trebonia sp.]|nr:DNA polymerase III subunit gamma and tau [Trebonia sp.]